MDTHEAEALMFGWQLRPDVELNSEVVDDLERQQHDGANRYCLSFSGRGEAGKGVAGAGSLGVTSRRKASA